MRFSYFVLLVFSILILNSCNSNATQAEKKELEDKTQTENIEFEAQLNDLKNAKSDLKAALKELDIEIK